MAGLLNRFFSNIGVPKLRMMQLRQTAELENQNQNSPFQGISQNYLDHIALQVRVEGFHVESLSVFRYGNLKPSESIFAIERWAEQAGLKVSFNVEHDICFFEIR